MKGIEYSMNTMKKAHDLGMTEDQMPGTHLYGKYVHKFGTSSGAKALGKKKGSVINVPSYTRNGKTVKGYSRKLQVVNHMRTYK